MAAGLVALLIIFLVWRSVWRPRAEDLKVRRAHQRALQSIAEEREFLNKQLESVKTELLELERRVAKQTAKDGTVTETIQSRRREYEEIQKRLSLLNGETMCASVG